MGYVESERKDVIGISRQKAESYLKHETGWASAVAGGVTLCILSPVLLILLTGLSAVGIIPVSELLAAGIGLTVLLVMVAAAVTVFIRYSMAGYDYTSVKEDCFELDEGVESVIREQKKGFLNECTKKISIGVAICILAVIPLIGAAFTENDLLVLLSAVLLLCAVSAGVNLFVRVGIVWDSYSRLLRDGDYCRRVHGSLTDKVGSFYWPLVAAGYLLWSLTTQDWGFTWMIWPVAGLVFAAIAAICRLLVQR